MVLYVGKGNYYQGVPARDLSDDEWAKIPRRVRKRVLELGLYEEVKPAPKKSPRKSDVEEITHDNS